MECLRRAMMEEQSFEGRDQNLKQAFLDRSMLVGARNQAPLALKWRHMIPASRLRHVAIPKTWKFELANTCRAGPFLAGNICKVIPAMNVGHDGVLIND
jgi:hypothetical protein